MWLELKLEAQEVYGDIGGESVFGDETVEEVMEGVLGVMCDVGKVVAEGGYVKEGGDCGPSVACVSYVGRSLWGGCAFGGCGLCEKVDDSVRGASFEIEE